MHDAAKSSEHSTSSPIPNAEPLPSAPRDRGSRSLSIAALIFVAMAAVMGWGASFVGLHEYGMQSMAGFTYWSAWLVPATFDGAAFACTLMTYRSSINGRSAVRGRILMWAFTGVSSWINWIHQPSQEAQIVAAGLPIAAVAVFDVVLLELRADYEAKHGMRGFRLRPGLLVLRWMVDRRSTAEAFRKQVIDIPVEEIAGLGTLAPPGTRRANALKIAAQAEQEQQAAGAIGERETERVEPRAEVQPRVEAEPAARTESSTSDDERAENSRNAPRTTSNETSRATEPAAQRPAAERAAASSVRAGSTAAETAESGSTARDSATAATTPRAAAKTSAAATSSGVTTKSSGVTTKSSGVTATSSGASTKSSDASATNSGPSAKASGAVAADAADSAAEARESGTTAQDERPATTARNAQRPAEEARSELATGGTADAPTVTLELPKVTAEQDDRAAAPTPETGTSETDTPETDTSATEAAKTGAAAKTTAKSGAAKQKPAATTAGGAKKPTDVQDTEQTLTLPPVPDGPMSDQDKRSAARYDYRMSVAAEQPVKPAELAKRYGLSESWGRRQINAARKSMAQEEAHEKSQLVGADQS